MTQTQNSNFRSLVGIAMLAIGSAVLLMYSAAMAWQFRAALTSGAIDSLGLLASIGFASLRVFHAVTLDHAAVLLVLRHILVLFSAFLVMLVGIAVLPRRAAGVNGSAARNLSVPRKGAQ